MKLPILTAAFAAILGITLAGIPMSLHAADTTMTNAPAAAKVKKTTYKGTISAVDTTANTITVQGTTKTLTLTIDPKTVIQKDKKAATLADFPIGTAVTGSYVTEPAGTMTAATLRTKTTTTASAKPAPTAAKPAAPAAQ